MELLEYRAPQRDRQRSAAAPQNVRFCTLRRSHNTRNGGGTRRVLPAALSRGKRSATTVWLPERVRVWPLRSSHAAASPCCPRMLGKAEKKQAR